MNERGGYHVLPSQFFCLTVSKFFIGESSLFQKKTGSGNVLGMRTGYHIYPSKLSVSHFTEKLHWKLFVVSEKIWQRKRFRDARGISHFSVEIFCVSLYQKLHWDFFGASKNFWMQKVCMDERRAYQVFLWKFFWITTEFFHSEIFGVLGKFSVREEIYGQDWGYRKVLSTFFLSQNTKKFHRELFRCFKKFLVAKKLHG